MNAQVISLRTSVEESVRKMRRIVSLRCFHTTPVLFVGDGMFFLRGGPLVV